MNKIIKDTISLTLITVVLGGVLGLVYSVTADPIARQEALKKQKACEEVYAEADAFETIDLEADGLADQIEAALAQADLAEEQIDEAYLAQDASGEALGYVLTVTTGEGYGGDIQFSMGVSADGVIQGISFLSISETAGLGMRADTDSFKSQFAGIQADSIQYSKTGASADNEIDALSGATITTNAVTNGVNAGLCAYRILAEGGQAE